MILGISVEQVIDHAATTFRIGREIGFTSFFFGGQRISPTWPAVRHTQGSSTH